jgi:HlyD family secretion protein
MLAIRVRRRVLAVVAVMTFFVLPLIAVSAAEPKDATPKPPAAGPKAGPAAGTTKLLGALGTLEPEEVVDVSAQVAGRIERVAVDYGSPVEVDTVLAQIDSAPYQARLEREKAGCTRAQAELAAAKAKLGLAESELQRAQEGVKTKAVSAGDFDTARCNVEVAKMAVVVAEAAVQLCQAAVKEAQLNLDHTAITSPAKGCVIDRRVNVGQMVAPTANAPSLFLIAGDLKKLKIWASVNEADIGRIHEKQPARFTVDAFPDKVFAGKVLQKRLNATLTEGVVTYTVVVSIDTPDENLLPYLTAHVVFEAEGR